MYNINIYNIYKLIYIQRQQDTWVFEFENYNPGQNIWNKIEKFNKTGQGKKSLVSIFACFLTAIAKV